MTSCDGGGSGGACVTLYASDAGDDGTVFDARLASAGDAGQKLGVSVLWAATAVTQIHANHTLIFQYTAPKMLHNLKEICKHISCTIVDTDWLSPGKNPVSLCIETCSCDASA